MKLDFAHHGLQFFFVTIGIEGRRPVLSRLVDERHRPPLLPPGEFLKAALVAMHGTFQAATISDFIIMPDHFHFLLIVNYEKDRGFNPLWATHRLLDAVEAAWAERTGPQATPNPAHGIEDFFPRRGSGAQLPSVPPSVPPLFERSPYLELSFDSRQLKTIRRYIKLNPARAIWKRSHPERFIRFTDLKHPILDPSRRWDAMGNPLLLSSPFLVHARLTMKKTVEEHAAEIEAILAKARCGAIPVSGFISPGEKELLRRLKAEPRARFVKNGALRSSTTLRSVGGRLARTRRRQALDPFRLPSRNARRARRPARAMPRYERHGRRALRQSAGRGCKISAN